MGEHGNRLKRMQRIELEILRNIHNICEKHHLRYYMFCGTILGAVRHKGFIPWDDDIDIAMPEVDYELFLSLCEKELPSHFCLETPYNTHPYCVLTSSISDITTVKVNATYPEIVTHVSVDIFPLYGYPKNRLKGYIHYIKYKFLLVLYTEQVKIVTTNNWKKWIHFALHIIVPHLITQEKAFLKLCGLLSKYKYDDSHILCNYAGIYHRKEIMDKSIFGTPTLIEFEGERFYGVENPHEYLIQLYGDYMLFPPEKERYEHHHCRVWFEDELEEYQKSQCQNQ